MVREVWAHFSADGNYFTKDGKRYPYEEGMGPYEYLMGALSGCFASTLRDEMEEKGVTKIYTRGGVPLRDAFRNHSAD